MEVSYLKPIELTLNFLFRHIEMEISFEYVNPLRPARPSGYYYRFGFYTNADGFQKEIFGFFENESHGSAKLGKCYIDDETFYYYPVDFDDDYFDRKTCRVTGQNLLLRYGPRTTWRDTSDENDN